MNNSTDQPSINQENKNKNKKSHGNRKEQHKRRRERRRQQKLTNNNIGNITEQKINTINNGNNHHHDLLVREQQQIQNDFLNIQSKEKKSNNKRKHQDITQNSLHVNKSMSQLSISQLNVKKKKVTEAKNSSINQTSRMDTIIDEYTRENNNELLSSENSIQKLKPKYLQTSIRIFKQMLSKTNENGKKIVQHLDTNGKLETIRQLTELINNVHYFELQKHLWQAYFDIGVKENIFTSEFTTNSIQNQSKTYFLPKDLIEKRQKTLVHQLQRTTNELHQFLINLESDIKQWLPSIDFNLLIELITECVNKHQQRLKREFQYKIEMTELNLKDRQSITKFYDLQPNQEQIHLIKNYWETLSNEQRITEQIEILRQRISLQRIPSKINKTIDHSLDHIQPMLDNSAIDKDQRAGLISKYSKINTQYKFDLMSLKLNTLESIRRGYQHNLIDLKEKLTQCCHPLLQRAITDRQQTMTKRHEKFLEHKLKTFFDDAPTILANE